MSKISLKHSGGKVVSLNSPTAEPNANDVAFKLPNADGTSGQVLKTDGSGNLSFGADTGGKILQVKSVTKTDTFTTTSSSTWVDITGLSVSITPAANSKILIMGSIQYSNSVGGSRTHFRLYRDSNAIAIGDASGNRARSTFASEINGGGGEMRTGTLFHLDTHGADGSTAVTYKFKAAAIDGNTLQVNKSVSDTDSGSYPRVPSFLTIMEVAG